MRFSEVLAAAALAGLAGCGTGGGDGRVSGALSAVSATRNLRALWESMQENATSAQAALVAFANISGFLAMLETDARPPAQAVQAGSFPGCVAVSGSAATFSSCTAGGVTLSGTAQKSGDTYTVDLNLGFSIAGYSGHVTYRGTLMASAQALNGGPLSLSVNLTTGRQSYALTIAATFSLVTLCPNGPSGGALTVSGSGTAAGASIDKRVTVAFGPGCGTAAVSGP